MNTVAVLGAGLLGAGFVENLLGKGVAVRVWNRTAARLAPLVETGAGAAATPAEAVAALHQEDPGAVVSIPCVAWKPRFTLGPMTDQMLPLQQQGFFTGYWTINDLGVIDAFLTTAVPNGILTNRVGLLNQRFEMVGTAPPYTPYRVSTP